MTVQLFPPPNFMLKWPRDEKPTEPWVLSGLDADMQLFVKPHFFQDHSGKKSKVDVHAITRNMLGFQSRFYMIAYTIPKIAVDYDGAPNAYAPPVSASQPNRFLYNLSPLDRNIKNAFNDASLSMNLLGDNEFLWKGVASRKATGDAKKDADLDARPFLADKQKRYPVVQETKFYKSGSAKAINPAEVASGVISTSLYEAGVRLGDVGLIIEHKTGISVPFMYCDTAGHVPPDGSKKSKGVSEFSCKVSIEMGGDEGPFSVFSFPGSSKDLSGVDPSATSGALRNLLSPAPGFFIRERLLRKLANGKVSERHLRNQLKSNGMSGIYL